MSINVEGVHLTGRDVPPSQAQLVSWRWLWTRLLAVPGPETTLPSGTTIPEGIHDDADFYEPDGGGRPNHPDARGDRDAV
jgi:hypothetical protein